MKLEAGGATLPFIARYRKEETGGLDEVGIRHAIEAKESWDEIVKRQAFILEEIDRQKKLTPALDAQIRSTFDLASLEDIYLPYKQKRKTKAVIAREAGLEPLASWLWDAGHGAPNDGGPATPEDRALPFVDVARGIADADAALAGAVEILIERLSEQPPLRQAVRSAYFDRGFVRTTKGEKAKPASRFENYFAHQEPVAALLKPQNSHRYLAMRRGWMDEELSLSLGGPLSEGATGEKDELVAELLRTFEARACSVPAFPGARFLARAARLSLRAHVISAIETEVHKALSTAGGELKVALLLLHGCDLGEAIGVLERSGGQLRAALALIGKPGPDPDNLQEPPLVDSPAISHGLGDGERDALPLKG